MLKRKQNYPYKNGKEYKVHIEEIKVTTIKIKARNLEEAKAEAKKLYRNGEIYLTGKDYKNISMQVEASDGSESSEWKDV